jgi:hypothetical protein
MRSVVLGRQISLDGSVAAADGSLEWMFAAMDDQLTGETQKRSTDRASASGTERTTLKIAVFRPTPTARVATDAHSTNIYSLFTAPLFLAHRFFWAAEIAFRAFADILRRGFGAS